MVINELQLFVSTKNLQRENNRFRNKSYGHSYSERLNNGKYCVASLKSKGKHQAFNSKYSLKKLKKDKLSLGLKVDIGELSVCIFEKAIEEVCLVVSTYSQLYLFKDFSIAKKVSCYLAAAQNKREFRFVLKEVYEHTNDIHSPKDVSKSMKERPLQLFYTLDSFMSKHNFHIKLHAESIGVDLYDSNVNEGQVRLDGIPFFQLVYPNANFSIQGIEERMTAEVLGLKMSSTHSTSFTYFFLKVNHYHNNRTLKPYTKPWT
jgi:hypothetical protein